MDQANILGTIESLFKDAGYCFLDRCWVEPSCFDLVARRDNELSFVKVQPVIGAVSKSDADGLKILATAFSGTPLFICEKTKRKPLEDDTVYKRYNIPAITPGTLEDILLRGMNPLIEAGPGGYYVHLYGESIKNRRLENDWSIGKIAETVGVSRRTLYGYEHGLTKASVLIAYKLEQVLGIPVVKPIEVSQPSILKTIKNVVSENQLLKILTKKLLKLNFAVFLLKKAPFDLIAKSPNQRTLVLGISNPRASRSDDKLEARTNATLKFSKIVDAQPLFVTDKKQVCIENIPVISCDEFNEIDCPEDLISLL